MSDLQDQVEVSFMDLGGLATMLFFLSAIVYLCGVEEVEPVVILSGICMLLSAIVTIASIARRGNG